MPSCSATSFAGGGPSLRPRPCGASGRVRSHETSCCSARRSSTSAPSGAVAATPIRIREGRRPAGKSAEVVVEIFDVVGDQPERRIAVLADLRERKSPPNFGLGPLARVLLGLGFVRVLVLVFVIVIVFVLGHRRGSVNAQGNSARI